MPAGRQAAPSACGIRQSSLAWVSSSLVRHANSREGGGRGGKEREGGRGIARKDSRQHRGEQLLILQRQLELAGNWTGKREHAERTLVRSGIHQSGLCPTTSDFIFSFEGPRRAQPKKWNMSLDVSRARYALVKGERIVRDALNTRLHRFSRRSTPLHRQVQEDFISHAIWGI